MTESELYRCVNCSAPAAALYKRYGPTVLKLAKCVKCNELVDKFIEYDPVIVMIDLMLMSEQAQKHVLYNTEFRSYWKLFIILMMVETYGVWRNDSLFNVAINSVCGFKSNSTQSSTYVNIPAEFQIPETWKKSCWAWDQEGRTDDTDLFIWEKDFYIQFISTFAGIIMFLLLVNSIMRVVMKPFCQLNEVSMVRIAKAFSLGNVHALFTLPMLVWCGADASQATRAIFYALVYVYGLTMFTCVFTVLYECPVFVTSLTMIVASLAKHATSFHVTPYLRQLIT